MRKKLPVVVSSLLLWCVAAPLLGRMEEEGKYSFEIVAQSDECWTGVAVSRSGRIFVNYPRWSVAPSVSVAELVGATDRRPYPDANWNAWDSTRAPIEHFVCVQSVYIDDQDNLWILDPASAGLRGVVSGGAKLMKIDLRTNRVVRMFAFDTTIAPRESYLNDVRIDTKRQYAYITDSGKGVLVVVDLATGKARRVLTEHRSTKAESTTFTVEGLSLSAEIHCDGLSLDPAREYLYYQALRGRTLYRVATRWLRDGSLTEQELGGKVEIVAQSGIADGIEFSNGGDLLLTSLEFNAIRKLKANGKIEVVLQDSLLRWPDAISVTSNGDLYVTTSQLHLGSSRKDPYRIFRIYKK